MDIAACKTRLITLREEVLASRARTDDDRKPVELDQQAVGRVSRVDAMQRQAMAVEAERRRGVQLQRIEAALKRIETGDFGYCVRCDGEIGEKRLNLDPATPTCVICADQSSP
ncbi:MAG: TraR/DksA C4-type zinc finger protein [Rhodospirillaceae bacterium]